MSNPNTPIFNERAGTFRRRQAPWLAAAIGALAIGAASAAGPLTTIEECIETGTDLVSLPGTAGGSLSATQCRGCESFRLKFDQGTRYFIGKEPVSYTKFREAAAKGDLSLDVFYQPKTRILTRLRLAAAGKK